MRVGKMVAGVVCRLGGLCYPRAAAGDRPTTCRGAYASGVAAEFEDEIFTEEPPIGAWGDWS